MKLRSLLLMCILLASAACANSPASPAASVPKAATGAAVTLKLGSKGDLLQFDKTELRAPAGSKITLRLTNNAAKDSGIKHNFVLVAPGVLDAVAMDGISAGDANDYVKPGDTRVLAHTKLTAPNATSEIIFDAPPPGTYEYLCIFPGHNVQMRGKLIIE